MQSYQQFDADIVPPACNLIEKEIPVQVLCCKFCKIFKEMYLAEYYF